MPKKKKDKPKRQLKADEPVEIRSPESPKGPENELDRFMSFMVEQMSTRWENQVFEELHQSTIEKFADAQPGNYARVYTRLARRTTRKLMKQFDDDRIEELVQRVLNKVNRRNRKQLYQQVEKSIGISSTELTKTEGLTWDINALIVETEQWVKGLRDETLKMYTNNVLRSMTTGESLSEIMQQFEGMTEKRKNHARFTARNQIAHFNSMTTKLRAQNLGLTRAVWVTSRDERVRECHRVRNGKEFDLDEGLYSSCDGKTLLPGIDYQCRCDYRLIVPGDEENED